MSKEIKVTCKGADILPIDALENFQGNLKKITKENLSKLKKRIIRDGINVPLFVWRVNDWCRILDGHQRLKALQSLREDGYIIPLIPVSYIEAEDEKDARQKLLGITSQFGEFEIEELNEWMKDFDDSINDTLRFSDTELKLDINIPENRIGKADRETHPEHDIPEDEKEIPMYELSSPRLRGLFLFLMFLTSPAFPFRALCLPRKLYLPLLQSRRVFVVPLIPDCAHSPVYLEHYFFFVVATPLFLQHHQHYQKPIFLNQP